MISVPIYAMGLKLRLWTSTFHFDSRPGIWTSARDFHSRPGSPTRQGIRLVQKAFICLDSKASGPRKNPQQHMDAACYTFPTHRRMENQYMTSLCQTDSGLRSSVQPLRADVPLGCGQKSASQGWVNLPQLWTTSTRNRSDHTTCTKAFLGSDASGPAPR